MKNYKNMNISLKDIALYTGMVIITCLAFYINYSIQFSSPVKVMIWIGWVLIFAMLGFFTTSGKKFIIFLAESKLELQKVVWPTRQETIQTTSIVMIMVTVTGFILWGVDSGMMWSIAKITHLG